MSPENLKKKNRKAKSLPKRYIKKVDWNSENKMNYSLRMSGFFQAISLIFLTPLLIFSSIPLFNHDMKIAYLCLIPSVLGFISLLVLLLLGRETYYEEEKCGK